MPLDDGGWGDVVDVTGNGDATDAATSKDGSARRWFRRPAIVAPLAIVLVALGVGGSFAASELRSDDDGSKEKTAVKADDAEEKSDKDTAKDEPEPKEEAEDAKDATDPADADEGGDDAVDDDAALPPADLTGPDGESFADEDGTDAGQGDVLPDDEEDDATTGGGLSRAAFIKQADAVCARHAPDIVQAQQYAAQSGDFSQLTALVTSERDDLQALGTPTEDAETIEAWFSSLDDVVQALESGNGQQLQASVSAANTTAGEYGMQVCNYDQ